nr:MAG TPA: KilAC domain protein [Caudoviricetes sp.]
MNELKIVEHQNQRVLLTSQLAESYGTNNKIISYNFNNNKERYEEGKHFIKLEGEEKKAFINRLEIQDSSKNAKTLYLWTERGAFLHAKSLNTNKAWEVYDSLVEHYFKSQEAKPSQLPSNYKEALLQLVAQVEANEKLELENKEMKPKALFADAVATSKTSILVGDLAKILKQNGINIGANRLFAELRDKGYLIKRKGSDWNMPTQKSMDMELFEIKEHTHIDGNGCNVTTKTPKVTGKGQVYFVNKFLGDRL